MKHENKILLSAVENISITLNYTQKMKAVDSLNVIKTLEKSILSICMLMLMKVCDLP